MVYFGTRLSENISRREPEGYLLCLNVPVARTGTQEYLPEELGLPPSGGVIQVYRPEEEVFSPACMASFEGMPVTEDHPSCAEGVTAENIRFLQKGHAHNIRRGTGAESDLLLADLMITDPDLADRILGGKREISCGYNYLLCEEEGQYVQREIRGNHLAVVEAGRAGPRVSIRDHRARAGAVSSGPADPLVRSGPTGTSASGGLSGSAGLIGPSRPFGLSGPSHPSSFSPLSIPSVPSVRNPKTSTDHERSSPMKKTIRNTPVTAAPRTGAVSAKHMARLMARMARDGETEELAEMISELVEPDTAVVAVLPTEEAQPAETAAEAVAEAVAEVVEAAAETAAEAASAPVPAPETAPALPAQDCAEIISLLRQILSVLSGPAAADEEPAAPISETPAEAAAETAAETTVEAVVEAVTQAVEATESAASADDLPADPMESLVAEAVQEAVEATAEEAAAEAVQAVLEPASQDEDPEDPVSTVLESELDCNPPSDRTADALRAAMATFRPILKQMAPSARRQAVSRIAANLKAQDRKRAAARKAAGTGDTYALLRSPANRTTPKNPQALGERIMASRNVNYQKN